ncbi:MAG: AtpZ/AtpI family protein [Lachnospiraceae bacterium]|nr:AtpZ/AtpI family protein [Robinsoniella sp.]MDY3765570.1 AtpZ/AtpI family protein [Lachnospiraceae bacterium]
MKNNREVFRSLAMITQIGISVLAPVILCVALGYWLDQKFGWHTTVVLVILGILAGARNAWILLNQMVQDDEKKKKK